MLFLAMLLFAVCRGGIFAVCWDIFAVCMDMTDCQYSALSRLTAFVFAVYQEHDRYLLVSQ